MVLNEPRTFRQTLNCSDSDRCIAAIEDEHKSLIQNQTWDITERPAYRNIVTCKWVYKVKLNDNNTIERYKAHLVARGFTQQFGQDFDETLSRSPDMNLSDY